MPSRAAAVPVNRNGAVGDFAAFAPVRRSMEEIFAAARALRRGEAAPPQPPRMLAQLGGYFLVRYHIASNELRRDLASVGADDHYALPERFDITALFGVLGPDGEAMVVLEVIADPQEPTPGIAFVFTRKENPVPRDVMLGFLAHLDVPPSWRAGADLQIASQFNAYWDEGNGGWQTREERHLVRVSFERHCFATDPVLTERVDVFVLPSPEHDLGDPDKERAYWAKHYYVEAAEDELHRLSSASRPGFSSWTTGSDPPGLVKVVNQSLDAEIARLAAAAAREAEETDDTPEEDRIRTVPPGP